MNLSSHAILTELEQTGKLKVLVKDGHCPAMVIRNLELTRFVDARVKIGVAKSVAVIEASEQFRICERSVFRIVKGMGI